MHFVSKAERSQLDEKRDPKERLRATLALALERLNRAEKTTNERNYDEALAELGGYLGLIGDLRDFIARLDQNKGSTRDLYRHFEMEVRKHIPHLGMIQRTTPAAYVRNIKEASEFIKDTIAEALDSFYGHSVLREPPMEKAPASAKDAAKDAPLGAPASTGKDLTPNKRP